MNCVPAPRRMIIVLEPSNPGRPSHRTCSPKISSRSLRRLRPGGVFGGSRRTASARTVATDPRGRVMFRHVLNRDAARRGLALDRPQSPLLTRDLHQRRRSFGSASLGPGRDSKCRRHRRPADQRRRDRPADPRARRTPTTRGTSSFRHRRRSISIARTPTFACCRGGRRSQGAIFLPSGRPLAKTSSGLSWSGGGSLRDLSAAPDAPSLFSDSQMKAAAEDLIHATNRFL
jgi:hypothetical protein